VPKACASTRLFFSKELAIQFSGEVVLNRALENLVSGTTKGLSCRAADESQVDRRMQDWIPPMDGRTLSHPRACPRGQRI
jgi:hypothetical protein